MPRIHTHYDNLKVTRNAPPEVIRAAYKTLCQKFHPDRNPNDESAKNTFLLIRSAYETLSDPQKRKLHDAWIASAESPVVPENISGRHYRKAQVSRPAAHQANSAARTKKLRLYGFWSVVAALVFVSVFFQLI